MIKTKTDGHSEANTPLTRILSIYLFDSVVFLPPKRNYMKTQLMATVVNYLLTLGSHCGLSTAAAEAPPTVRGFNVRATRPLPSDAGWNFIWQIFTISSGVLQPSRWRHVGRCLFVFSRWTTRNADMSWMTSRRSLRRRRPLARKASRRQAVAGPIWDVA